MIKMISSKINYSLLLILFGYSIVSYGQTNSQTNSQTIEEFHNNYYTQICQGILACSNDVGIAESLQYQKITNLEACVVVLSQKDSAQAWAEVITQKTAIYQAENTQACLTSITDMSCSELERRLVKPAQIAGCQDVVLGTIENTAQCNSSLECKSNNASCYGTCEVPRPLQCGDEICGASEYCDTNNNRCETLKETGGSCNNFSECLDHSCSEGLCVAPPPVIELGGQCGNGIGHICSLGEFCAEDKCTPFKKKGESCSENYEDFMECEAPLNCQNNMCE